MATQEQLESALRAADAAGATDDAKALAQEIMRIRNVPAVESKPNATLGQKVVASLPSRIMKGMNDPIDAGAQYLPYALGAITGGFGLAPNKVSNFFFNESDKVSKGITEREQGYQAARKAVGQDGFDAARLTGQVVSPATYALSKVTGPVPTSTIGRVAYGAGAGVVGGAATPVVGADSKTLGQEKLAQEVIGGAVGAVATPVVGKAIDLIGTGIDRAASFLKNAAGKSQAVNPAVVLQRIRIELGKDNINLDDIPETIRNRVVADVSDALKAGRKVDAAAIIRKADVQSIGGKPTLGMISRDPAQFTREWNLRGVENAGEPLMQASQQNRQAIGNVFNDLGSNRATDVQSAAPVITNALRKYDKPIKAAVDASYQTARDEGGRYAQMNTAQFSKMANDALDEGQLGALLPEQARTILNRVSKGEIPFNVNTYTQIRETLGGLAADKFRQGDRKASLAINKIVEALDKTNVDSAAGAEAIKSFELARKAAKFRFDKIDAIPALKAVLDGKVNDDQFVSKYVIGGGTKDLNALAKVLDRPGKDAVREQIASHLQTKAFGSNVTADAAMATERYNQELNKLGRGRLEAFFSKDEVDKLFTAGRVGAYMSKPPQGAAPNFSNTAAATFNLLQRLKGAAIAVPIVKQIDNQNFVSRSLAAQPSSEAIPVLSEPLRRLLPVVPIGAGMASGESIR